MVFTNAEVEYLASQRLGRLATLSAKGTLQNSPVSFRVDAGAGTIDIYGRDLGATAKFRNVLANGQVAFVVDDLESLDPWTPRCLEIRGSAEALIDQDTPGAYLSDEIIRIHPRRIISWGLGLNGQQGSRRNVEHEAQE